MMEISDIGLIGLAVMGENLALNLESKGYTVSVYNRVHPDRESVVTRFVEGRGKGKCFHGTYTCLLYTSTERIVFVWMRSCRLLTSCVRMIGSRIVTCGCTAAVSYTHLDVYKRQRLIW